MTQSSPEAAAEVDPPAQQSAEVIALSDRVLLERHVRGEREAFTKLVKMHASSVYGYLSRCGIRGPERDDLFQEIFCKVHRAAQTSLPDGAVKPWLFTIAINTVRDHYRRTKVRSVVRLQADAGSEVAAAEASPQRSAEARETALFLEAQLDSLPLPQREALVLCAVEGLSVAEAADALGEPEETVKTRLRRARLALAQALARRAKIAEREESR